MIISQGAIKLIACGALCCVLAQAPVYSAEQAEPGADASSGTNDAARAQALLHRAVAHYRDSRNPLMADFGSKGAFVDDELYVYIISTAGVLLASGGPSSSLIGQNVSDRQDALGKPFLHELLSKARRHVVGEFEYRWLNPVDNKVELKVGHFQKVGSRIIVVGHYVGHAPHEQSPPGVQGPSVSR